MEYSMKLRPKPVHSEGEGDLCLKSDVFAPVEVDTFDGKVRVEWEPDAKVSPLGQLPFFIQYLKIGQRFDPWVNDCPLTYQSNNAPDKRDVLGSFLLSILSGHTRYAHISTLANDTVNTQLLGMNKVVSDDSARRALKKIDENAGARWLQEHLYSCYEPLLTTPWILDVDVTVKPLYGSQEGAVKGYNPHKPGRPCQTFHTYMIGNLRLILDVEVKAGNLGNSSHSLPGLMSLLNRLPDTGKPQFIRGDCDWGTDKVMSEMEQAGYHYLFKMKKTVCVKELINHHHDKGQWSDFKAGWEAKEASLRLTGWKKKRRVVLVRRQLKKDHEVVLEYNTQDGQQQLAFMKDAENIKAFEYSVLVTNMDAEPVSIVQHYRDRADCENNFDELKNHWGWGGFTTHKIKSCRFISRITALVYNWWTLFVRLAIPECHREAITSRPLLLSSVGRMTESGRQKTIRITSQHNEQGRQKEAWRRVSDFFTLLKAIAPQLTRVECWTRILRKSMEVFMPERDEGGGKLLGT
jgi:hypothetical protein